MLELLQERVTLFCELAEVTSGQDNLQPPTTRYLFRADTPQAPRAEKLLLDATAEGNRPSFMLTKKNYLFCVFAYPTPTRQDKSIILN